jgi:hypothetical protein
VKSLIAPLAVLSLAHGLTLLFVAANKRDERFRRAIADFEATYQFRVGSSAQQVHFDHGQVWTSAPSEIQEPDFEIVILDIYEAVKLISREPENVLRLLMENRIEQRGNKYFLFRFGYLCGLTEKWLRKSGPATWLSAGWELGRI